MARHESPYRRTAFPLLAIALLPWALWGCGGGGGNETEQRTSLPVEQAWTTPTPSTAQAIDATSLRTELDAGRARLAGPASWAAEQQTLALRRAEARRTVAAAATLSPELSNWLAAYDRHPDPQATEPARDAEGELRASLMSPAEGLLGLADAIARNADPAQLRRRYAALWPLAAGLPTSGLPQPAELVGADLPTLRAALAALDAALATRPRAAVLRTRDQGTTQGQRRSRLSAAPQPGSGTDGSSGCGVPQGLFARHWFPLRGFLNPVRDQAARGTCWAFTVAGALEIRDRVMHDEAVNLSEQFIIYRTRAHWFPNDQVESASQVSVLEAAVQAGQVVPPESFWTYNPSRNRASTPFAGACIGYTGSCSETSHQGPQLRTTDAGAAHVATVDVGYSGPGRRASPPLVLWNRGDTLPLGTLVSLLDQGVPVMASMPIHAGFDSIERSGPDAGVLRDESETFINALGQRVAGDRGSHAVLLVGFLSNEQLSRPGHPVDVPGGGWFVLRNSWGCGWGDGGYAYVSAAYVRKVFLALSVPEFGAERSAAWQAEQAVPGRDEPLQLSTAPLGIVSVPHNVETDLAIHFRVSHPIARQVQLRVSTDLDGVLYDGAWDVAGESLLPPSLRHLFIDRSPRVMSLRASLGAQVLVRELQITVSNATPSVTLSHAGPAYADEATLLTAQPADANEPDTAALCRRTRWQVSAPDRLLDGDGCAQRVVFGDTGLRRVTATTTDAEGLAASAVLDIDVQAASASPYPRIADARAVSREWQPTGLGLRVCTSVAVPTGATIDLRQSGCTSGPGAAPPRHGAQADIDNPTAEPLSYQWSLWVRSVAGEERLYGGPLATDRPEVSLTSPGNQTLVTTACRLELEVLAPQPARHRSRVVWSGQCTYRSGALG